MTYLVGTPRRFKEYCKEHGVSTRGWYVAHVEKVADIERASLGSQVIFLRDWEQLPEHNQIYNWAIGRQTLERLIAEAKEEEGP